MGKSNVDVHEMRIEYGGEPFSFDKIVNERRPYAVFRRDHGEGQKIQNRLYIEAVRDYLASGAGEMLLDVATSLELNTGEVFKLFPTEELELANERFGQLALT